MKYDVFATSGKTAEVGASPRLEVRTNGSLNPAQANPCRGSTSPSSLTANPRAATFVTYSQSENPRSPNANDYTVAYSRKRWHQVPFCGDEVRRATLSTQRLRIPAQP